MEITKLLSAAAISVLPLFAYSAQPVSDTVRNIMDERLAPKPVSTAYFEGLYNLADKSAVTVETPAKLTDAQKSVILKTFKDYWKLSPNVVFTESDSATAIKREGYNLDIAPQGLKISAKDFEGVRHALKTVRQLAEVGRDNDGYFLQSCKITDAPALDFRAVHLCIYPETTPAELEKRVRLAAYYKFNYVIIEPWGTFPFKTHPELSFNNKTFSRIELKRIIDLAYELGITPVPQLTILGHVSGGTNESAKHAILTRFPEMAKLLEPHGWSWCMSNPEAVKLLEEAVAEIHEFFGNPPFFHIGCDEAYDMATCYKCRQTSLGKLLGKHILHFRDLLEKRGARTIMWHDMLVEEGDPRWDKCTATGHPNTDMNELFKVLPKDVVIADWQYDPLPKGQKYWPTSIYFKENGFDTLICPYFEISNIKNAEATACDNKLFGMICTTWSRTMGSPGRRLFYTAANAAWGSDPKKFSNSWKDYRCNYNTHLRTMDIDSGIDNYEDIGSTPHVGVERHL